MVNIRFVENANVSMRAAEITQPVAPPHTQPASCVGPKS